jgi:putative ATP-dependent endonuclease of the OLD family
MARIRKLEIQNFRSIRKLDWIPSEGINCLVGPGDSGKSTVLDAIDLCLGSRRTVAIYDTDFPDLTVGAPISITATIGALPETLKNLDNYGDFLRSFDKASGEIDEEPKHGWETVLSLNLTVADDLEPVWSLVSAQAQANGIERTIRWSDRLAIAPARLGNYLNMHLGWTRGSVLNRLSEGNLELGPKLAHAARDARASFGKATSEPLGETLKVVKETAEKLGIPVGKEVQALLDAHAISIGDGAVALHNDAGIPLRSLGTGSARLLIAGLQRAASAGTGMVLVDEVELGLEPHRLQRLLISLGSKDDTNPLQVFMTTHSPITVRELSTKQLSVLRRQGNEHEILAAGNDDETQGTARSTPEAFLAQTVILCEGPSEVGLVRGLDIHWSGNGHASLLSSGAIAVSWGGSHPEKGFNRGIALMKLGYRVLILVDNDKPVEQKVVQAYEKAGGQYIQWEAGRATEHELFMSLDDKGVGLLIKRAIEINGRQSIADQIAHHSTSTATLDDVELEEIGAGFQEGTRKLLGDAAHKGGWFKTHGQGCYEDLARDIVALRFEEMHQAFVKKIKDLFGWAHEH